MKAKEKKLTLKEKKFVRLTAETLNPSEAVRRTYNIGSKGGVNDKLHKENVIRQIANENLTKPAIRKSLQEVLEDNGVNNDLITRITTRNLKQNKNLPASNQVLDMLHKIKGNYTPERRININVTPDNINNRLQELEDELKQLQ